MNGTSKQLNSSMFYCSVCKTDVNESERLVRESHAHCKLIDFIEFITLW
jgi:hypothetical protein